jgi:hypothetical protein
MGKFKIQKSATVNVGFDFNNQIDGVLIGGTGGNTSITGDQVQVKANLAVAQGNAYIVKGGVHKFLVSNGNTTTTCLLANTDVGNLQAGQMSIQALHWDGGANLNYFYVSKMSNKFVWDFSLPLPQKYLWTGGEAIGAAADPLVGFDIVRIPLN